MIKINSVKKSGTGIKVAWENSFAGVSSLSIVFDDQGSCTTIGLDPSDLDFSTNKLSRHRTYDIYLKALTADGWTTSEQHTYRLD